jgi:small ligand-binding sensory domain FIST
LKIASALSTLSSVPAMAQDIEAQIQSALQTPPDLLLLFVSYQLADTFGSIVSMVRESLKPMHLLAVAGESVLGAQQEIERSPAVSALAISCPSANLRSFHLAAVDWQDFFSEEDFFLRQMSPAEAGAAGPEGPIRAFFLFGDPFTTPIVQLLDACSHSFPKAPVIGGMASGLDKPDDSRLALNEHVFSSGVVGVSFSGPIEIDCLVSQGCRPIGETFVVTKSHQNVVEQLDGKPALAAIEEMVSALPLLDRQLLANGGLQVGRVIDQGKGSYGRGDFLIRSLVGVKRETGAVLVGDILRTGQTLQFHVRDAKTADEEMRLLLEGETMLSSGAAAGALLVSCNGRGTKLFDRPHHDIALAHDILGQVPIAGFFAAGELGPVGDKNFIHGHTAVLAIFRETTP